MIDRESEVSAHRKRKSTKDGDGMGLRTPSISSRSSKSLMIGAATDLLKDMKTLGSAFESPVDLQRTSLMTVKLKSLVWENYLAKPTYLKLANTGKTVVLTALYPSLSTPTLSGGPLVGPYKFKQAHFHWGENNSVGSEHKVEGVSFPLEAHVVLHSVDYADCDEARRKEDGIVILVYLFKLLDMSDIPEFAHHLSQLRAPGTQIPLEPVTLQTFLPSFTTDYITYYGMLKAPIDQGVLWIISRAPLAITHQEMDLFRNIECEPGVPMRYTPFDTKPIEGRSVYLSIPLGMLIQTVLHNHPNEKVEEKKFSGRSSRKKTR